MGMFSTFVDIVKDPVKAISNPIQTLKDVGNAVVSDVKSLLKGAGNAGKSVVAAGKKVVDFAKSTTVKTAASLYATAKAVAKNPFPTIVSIGLTAVGVPYPIANAAVSVLNGGDWKDAAINLGLSYVGANVQSKDLYKQVLINASLPAAAAYLKGGTEEQIRNAAIAGAVSGYVSETLTRPKELGGYGFQKGDLDTKMVTNATNSATSAILNGRKLKDMGS
jgi:hypothetical protein